MKKTYIIPELQLTLINGEKLLVDSLEISETTVSDKKGGWVKEDVNNSSTPSYNVWDDDWSKN